MIQIYSYRQKSKHFKSVSHSLTLNSRWVHRWYLLLRQVYVLCRVRRQVCHIRSCSSRHSFFQNQRSFPLLHWVFKHLIHDKVIYTLIPFVLLSNLISIFNTRHWAIFRFQLCSRVVLLAELTNPIRLFLDIALWIFDQQLRVDLFSVLSQRLPVWHWFYGYCWGVINIFVPFDLITDAAVSILAVFNTGIL